MIELISGISANELTKKLLIEENILIKDLTEKIGHDGKEYIRVAIRNSTDNDKLVGALIKHINK
jgi:histidinol-phosphate/aromatic aminotransferase/cobyric acid decarboxylase-like protein